MRIAGMANNGSAHHATRRRWALIRVGVAVTVSLTSASALATNAVANTSSTEPQALEPPSAGASNGGVASATTGGEVNIGQIITGENTGNSIDTGDVAGSAEISGGEINYPTDVNVTLELGPPVATSDGGDEGTATTSDDDAHNEDEGNKNNGKDGEDITIINRNDNQSKAKVVE